MTLRLATIHVIVISLFGLVWADVCSNFCVRELGPTGCGKGPWCKDNRRCQSLFWLDREGSRPRICLFAGDKEACPTNEPVLCEDARVAMTGDARMNEGEASYLTTIEPVTSTGISMLYAPYILTNIGFAETSVSPALATTFISTSTTTTTTGQLLTTTTTTTGQLLTTTTTTTGKILTTTTTAETSSTTMSTTTTTTTTIEVSTTQTGTTVIEARAEVNNMLGLTPTEAAIPIAENERLVAALSATSVMAPDIPRMFLNALLFPRIMRLIFPSRRGYEIAFSRSSFGAATVATTSIPEETVIDLHYNREVADYRPRCNVRFLGSGRDEEVFSLMFDTGSESSHIKVGRPGGYMDNDRVVSCSGGSPSSVRFGHGRCVRTIPVIRKIVEMAEIVSSTDAAVTYAFEMELLLTSVLDSSRGTGIGLVGAGRNSNFAIAVGVFGIIGNSEPYCFPNSQCAGQLIIGDVNIRQDCTIYYFPLSGRLPNHWAVPGSVAVGPMASSASTTWIVDTGMNGFAVPEESFTEIIRIISSLGGTTRTVPEHGYRVVSNCQNCIRELPTLYFRIGILPTSWIEISLRPSEYLVNCSQGLQECVLWLDHNEIYWAPHARLLGMGILKKLLTVFDNENDRIGFCHWNSS